MASQRILLTTMPRGASVDPDVLPLSVLVSPRLTDADRLDSFGDWLSWTEHIANDGLSLTLGCGGRTANLSADTAVLRPDLWAALFNADTLVRPHVFDDYTGRTVFSYPVRLALSSLKNIYQRASLDLALPEREGSQQEHRQSHQGTLRSLLDGLQVGWNERSAPARRQAQRDLLKRGQTAGAARAPVVAPEDLGRDGLVLSARMPEPGSTGARAFNRMVVGPFSIFSHPPSGPALERLPPPDWQTHLDFHQALSALNNYPQLQRALGLVFDFDVPLDLVPVGPGNAFVTIAVTQVSPGWKWSLEPDVPRLETAVVHSEVDGGHRVFFAAPLWMVSGGKPAMPAIGLLPLEPAHYGLAQIDVDGALHKNIMLSETLSGYSGPPPLVPPHPDVFDPSATLPALRSGGLSLFADERAAALLTRFAESKAYNEALDKVQPRPFSAEDLVRGHRIDVWDSKTTGWHSLHRRNARYEIADAKAFDVTDEEGFVKLGATQASPDPDRVEPADDFYLHEAIARWSGWSLSAPMPGKHLSRFADPERALPKPGEEDQFVENEAPTPFKMRSEFHVVPGTLPRMRFGVRYRMRARVVDLAGNSLALDALLAERLSRFFALPRDADGVAYLRFEPVVAPQLVVRDASAITRPGSELERLVIRTFNSDASLDSAPANLVGSDRHVVPPRTSVEIGERLGMFDDANGKLIATADMHALISQREKGEFQQTPEVVSVAGQDKTFPLEPAPRLDAVPYLPDPLASGAALRDLPGSPDGTSAQVAPGVGPVVPAPYRLLDDPNPRAGSVLVVDFGGGGDWQKMRPFRIAPADGAMPPSWDPMDRVLTVFLPKGTTSVVPLSSWIAVNDLKLMGVWEWLREYVEVRASVPAEPEPLEHRLDTSQIGQVLQRALEGGHWMLTPPRLLTFVHAVQQPVGSPRFTGIALQHPASREGDANALPALQTQPETAPTADAELAALTAWRRPGALDAYLIGGLRIHGASTEKVDIVAEWEDPVDDPALGPPGTRQHRAPVDELPIDSIREHILFARSNEVRAVGYYVPSVDLVAFATGGDALGHLVPGVRLFQDTAPRHHIGDVQHHIVRYTAVATSRYRDYFAPELDFTRRSEPVEVSVPASARPLAPGIVYALPLFGWQRHTSSSVKHSVRFGGGIRVYLERGWYSSGQGELLGVVLWNYGNGVLDRESWKPFITQWGIDPIWETTRSIGFAPSIDNFSDAVAAESALTLEANVPGSPGGARGVVNVAGYPVAFDGERNQWYCDITLNTFSTTYMPFLRLALARYQPHALPDAKLSSVVLADFVQLTPDRTAVVTANPAHARELRVTVSGPAPGGPAPAFSDEPVPDPLIRKPTDIEVTLEQRDPAIDTDLGWTSVPTEVGHVVVERSGPAPDRGDITLWQGSVQFGDVPARNRFRVRIEEYEYPPANYTVVIDEHPGEPGPPPVRRQPRRLVYAETILVDSAVTEAAVEPTTGEGMPAPPDVWPPPSDPPYGPYVGPTFGQPGSTDSLPELSRAADPHEVDGHVKLLQAMLNAAGALPTSLQPLRVDGNFGGETESAVQNFQGSHLLPVSGTADGLTWYALTFAAPCPLLEPGVGVPGMQGALVAALQRALNLAGAFPRLGDNGEFDSATDAALARFQQQRGLVPSGGTDLATWLALTDVRDESGATGSMILTFDYDVTLADPIRFSGRTDADAPAPETEPIELSAIGRAGYVVELHDANDQPIYRRTLWDPFGLRMEGLAQTDDPTSGQLVSVPAETEPGTVEVTLPRLPGAAQVVFIGSPLDANRMDEPASVLARFDIADLA
ncbi:peptidoglycan-binding domain-containing protein [Paraburkholderia hospita]|nr:peptidoglycan-binding protein [Paraburkholderia hospita]